MRYKMENKNKILIWAVVIILAVFVLFNLDFTGNLARSGISSEKTPLLKVLTPTVQAGSSLLIKADNLRSNQRIQIHYPDGTYSGISFPVGKGDCEFASAGYYNCKTSYDIPHSILPDGNYYVQVKSDSQGRVIGNKDAFKIINSKYQKTGR